jgi:hypothetical protein
MISMESGSEGIHKNRPNKKRHRGRFSEGEEVRIARKENLGNKVKDQRGRFMKRGVMVNRRNKDSCLVGDRLRGDTAI